MKESILICLTLLLTACNQLIPSNGGDLSVLSSPPAPTMQTHARTGSEVAIALNTRYGNMTGSCPGGSSALKCSGVIIRSVDNGNFNPWDPSPSAERLGAVSFSYLRRDTHVTNLYRRAGFIFLPQNDAALIGKGMTYLCMYAYDAGTVDGERPGHGCGLKPRNATNEDLSTCSAHNAATVTGWYAFTKTIPNRDYQCSFSAINPYEFSASIQVRSNKPSNIESIWNELLVKVWPQNHGARLPIEAFFFQKNDTLSLNDAKTFQTKFKRVTGLWVPVVALDFSQVNGSPFSYNSSDQAVQN